MDIWEVQRARTKRFPRDRIAFWKSAAKEDMKNFRKWRRGSMSLDTLRKAVAEANFLSEVTEEQIITELKMTGWWAE